MITQLTRRVVSHKRNISSFIQRFAGKPNAAKIFANRNRFTRSLSWMALNKKSNAVNILIAINQNDTNDDRIFGEIKSTLNELIGLNKFTIYNVHIDDIKNNNWWHSSTAFLVLIADCDQQIFTGFEDSKIIRFGLSDLIVNNQKKFSFDRKYFRRKLIDFLRVNDQEVGESKCGYDNDNTLTHSQIYLITNNVKRSELFESVVINGVKHRIRFIDNNRNQNCDEIGFINGNSEPNLNVVVDSKLDKSLFDTTVYYANLKTKKMGQTFLFADITSSTMTLIEPFSGVDGFVVIANKQTKGRGRNQNEWLSPKGCAMFTAQIRVSLRSKLGQRLGFVQHLAALSVIKAINEIPGGYDRLDIRIKWPNDILCNKTKAKLCGILVSSVLCGDNVNVLIGCGINVSNGEPSYCLNDLIDEYNKHRITDRLSYVSCEEVIARTVSQFEQLIEMFELNCGLHLITQLYLKYWIHCGQSIKLGSNGKIVTIETLDNNGYLLVRDSIDGKLITVHPDGNRFDMLCNLKAK